MIIILFIYNTYYINDLYQWDNLKVNLFQLFAFIIFLNLPVLFF